MNPRTTYLPAESEVLADYLARGGSALFLFDLGFVVEPRLAALLATLGVRLEQQVVIDPLDHYSTDHESVAVPVYEPHAVTERIALTFYPGIRPIALVPPPPGVTVTPLFASSKESYARSRAAGRGAAARRGRARARRRRCPRSALRGGASSASPSRARGRGRPPMRPRRRSAP